MRRGFYWPLFISLAIISLLIVAGLIVVQTASDCLGNVACIRRAAWLAAGGLVLVAGLAARVIGLRMIEPARQLTRVMKRITVGERDIHILPQRRDELGQLVRAFVEMQEQMDRELASLSQQERQLSAVLNQMGDGVLIIGESGKVQLINPAAARLLQTAPDAALGRTFAEVARHHELIDVSRRGWEEDQEQIAAVELGDSRFWQVVVTPLQRPRAKGQLIMLQDLTRVRHLETVRRDFISNLSHELRTPLASLRAVVETLQDGALSDPRSAERFLNHAANEIDVLTQMTEELLELSRIESGRVPLQLAPTAVADLLNPAVERMRRQLKRKKQKLTIDLPPDLPLVLADAGRIGQVISNLLHNATKFTPAKGKITISASVEALHEGGGDWNEELPSLLIRVSDTGIGIPAVGLTRIFERFYKTDPARSPGDESGGTGLGLAIARRIVEAHDGRIWAESKQGKGSTFFVALPISD